MHPAIRMLLARITSTPPSMRKGLAAFSGICILIIVIHFFSSVSSPRALQPTSRPIRPAAADELRHPRIQFPFKKYGRDARNITRAEEVRAVMKKMFKLYREHAWGFDEIKPLSGEGKTTRNNWGATIIDSITTFAVMGLEDELKQSLRFAIDELDFSKAKGLVDPFETTIRYLGSLVSALDLIDNGVIPAQFLQEGDREKLLAQAVKLAHKLAPAYDTPTGMPWPRVNFANSSGCLDPNWNIYTVGPARAGTSWLENKVLSRLSKEDVYVRNATRSWEGMVFNKGQETFPGFVKGAMDIRTGEATKDERRMGAGHDSYYEYLLKAHIHSPDDLHAGKYRDRWLQMAVTIMKDFSPWSKPTKKSPEKKRFLLEYSKGQFINEMGHLACFAGGMFAMGGRYFGKPDILQLGLDITDACHHTYAMMPMGVGPETFRFVPEKTIDTSFLPTGDALKEYEARGFWSTDKHYILRPETVESYFYAYRITGDIKYQDWAWDAFTGIVKATESEFGYAEIKDVTKMDGGKNNLNDGQESFWAAETLKYLYLIFADDNVASLDEWVFTTEAHPLRIYE